ncbi:MAG: hypothetical protein F4X95_03085 [Oligoflexia bacterium]|nr:hypothetical protein [Oligoflexia bacterium]
MKLFNCPVCGSKANKAGHTLFCKCGWSKSLNKKTEMMIQKNIVKNIFIAGFGLMALAMYLGHWGSASLKIAPLKISQWTGQLNKDSFTKLSDICASLKKYDCVEKAHISFFRSSGNLEILEQLGDFQYRRKKFNQANKTYNQYFTNKGNSVKAAYNYARILEKAGNTEAALSYYKYALEARPGTIQVTVMRSYIDLLVKSGQRNKAKQELLKLKPLLSRVGSLVKQEYNRWNKQVISHGS